MGQRPTAGYSVEIEEVSREGSVLTVKVRSGEPPSGTLQAAVVTHPYVLVKVARRPGIRQVRFVDAGDGRLLRTIETPG